VRDKAIAQEIVQDVFITLWIKRTRLQSVSDIRAFTLRAVQNRIYDHFDKQAFQQRYTLRITQSESAPSNATLQQIEYDETLNIIDKAIDKLPDTTKKIFRMSRFENLATNR
jgi:RNA polymerase sigma-70 factor (ECF subfamily)